MDKSTVELKLCHTCKIEKQLSDFHKNKTRKFGVSDYCKECQNKVDRKNYKKNKDKIKKRKKELYNQNPQKYIKISRAINLKHRFGMTLDDYDRMVKEQNNLCAICNKSETSLDNKRNKIRDLSIDHDHKTGKVRGLLCNHCNHLLGNAKDDTDILLNAINYLKDSK